MLVRKKIVLLLLTVIPCLFLMIVQLTSSEKDIVFRLGITNSKEMLHAAEINVALVFVSLATIGFLASFLSLNLFQEYDRTNRRLVICGYQSSELIFAGVTVMIIMTSILVLSIGFSISFFFRPVNIGYMMLGMFFTGVTYGSYGLLVACFVKGQLEGVLSVVLLANIDAGWIQNPLFFNDARNKVIIESLPAYFPSQLCMVAAFTDLSIQKAIASSFIYMSAFLLLSLFVSYYKMRIQPQVNIKSTST